MEEFWIAYIWREVQCVKKPVESGLVDFEKEFDGAVQASTMSFDLSLRLFQLTKGEDNIPLSLKKRIQKKMLKVYEIIHGGVENVT